LRFLHFQAYLFIIKARLRPDQLATYETSLKYYRDMKNVVDTSFEEGKLEGKLEGKIEIAQNLLKLGYSTLQIVQATGLSEEEIKKLV
jgi:predicted transposase/invertase (TIGR01784 family)